MTPSEYKGTAPQEAQADPQPDAPKAPFWSRDHDPLPVAPVPQTEGECPTCEQCHGKDSKAWRVCPSCNRISTGKDKA